MKKFELRYSVLQSDGRVLRSIRWFDSLLAVYRFTYDYRMLLREDWHIVQHFDSYTDIEKKCYPKNIVDCYEQELPF